MSLRDWLGELHASHDCDPGPCRCKCECKNELGCRAVIDMCTHCYMQMVRYDEGDTHEPKEKEQP